MNVLLLTVPLPVNSTNPEWFAATKTKFIVAPLGTGLEGTPIKTPWELLGPELLVEEFGRPHDPLKLSADGQVI